MAEKKADGREIPLSGRDEESESDVLHVFLDARGSECGHRSLCDPRVEVELPGHAAK